MSDMMDICEELGQVIDSISFLEDVVYVLMVAKYDREFSEKGLSGLYQLLGNIIQRTKAVADGIEKKISEEQGCATA